MAEATGQPYDPIRSTTPQSPFGLPPLGRYDELVNIQAELHGLKQQIPPKWLSVLILPVIAIIGALLIAMMTYQQASISDLRADIRDNLSALRTDVNGVRTELQGLRGDMQPFLKAIEKNQEAIQASQRVIEGMRQKP